ncbi:MAG TPA: alpha/beta hydrolase [Solirubrobacteraceae bacterium]|nr:alpha/beta hydrolase [Solirubrobacteraceae bacterium]
MSAATAGQPELRAIELEGRRFAWRSFGAGPPLVLVNGYAASSADWDPTLLAALASRLTVICPDNRGTGESELGDPAALTVGAMADDTLALLDALGLESAPLAGWSMGGYVAQTLALRAPARVSRLVLMATGPGGGKGVPAQAGVWERLTDHSGSAREQATRLIELLFGPALAPAIDAQFGDVVAQARAGLSPRTLAAQERVLAAWQAEPEPLPGEDAPPVLAIVGELDAIAPPGNADALAALWPRTRVERIAGGGHAFMAQEPERVAALIADFAGAG